MTTTINGWHNLSDKMEDLADNLREMQKVRQTSPDDTTFKSTKGAIRTGVNNAMDNHVIPEARSAGSAWLPSGVEQTIKHDKGRWIGDQYRHKYFAEHDLVGYHEFGTGIKADHPIYDGTVDVPGEGYWIPKPPGYPDVVQIEGADIAVDYVVHPGVKSRHFMRRALEKNLGNIEDNIANELDKMGPIITGEPL